VMWCRSLRTICDIRDVTRRACKTPYAQLLSSEV